MNKTVIINVVGLSPSLISEANTPALHGFAKAHRVATIGAVVPAVTTTVQSTYLTGLWPAEHGVVGNGWFFRETAEVRFWMQSNRLVDGEKVWEKAKRRDPKFTCANLFWWYNMYSSADYSVTPRPMYPADGRKIPDVYAHPESLRGELQEKLGRFPLFNFWGPATSIRATRWIADAAMEVDRRYDPTLTLIYLPHLDYGLQRGERENERQGAKGAREQGEGRKNAEGGRQKDEKRDGSFFPPSQSAISGLCTQDSTLSPLNPPPSTIGDPQSAISKNLREVDAEVRRLLEHYRDARVVILSEYGITPVSRPVHVNRVLREAGMIAVREEMGRELLDAGASAAFAVADHQVAHVYVRDPAKLAEVKKVLEATPGIARVLDEEGKRELHLDHARSGELVCLAQPDAWFTYYYWLDDARAPDFARTVDIHRKPGYDPVELFIDPALAMPKLRIAWTLFKRKLGFRTLMNVIPLDATLVKGSHGLAAPTPEQGPLLMTNAPGSLAESHVAPTDICGLILRHIFD